MAASTAEQAISRGLARGAPAGVRRAVARAPRLPADLRPRAPVRVGLPGPRALHLRRSRPRRPSGSTRPSSSACARRSRRACSETGLQAMRASVPRARAACSLPLSPATLLERRRSSSALRQHVRRTRHVVLDLTADGAPVDLGDLDRRRRAPAPRRRPGSPSPPARSPGGLDAPPAAAPRPPQAGPRLRRRAGRRGRPPRRRRGPRARSSSALGGRVLAVGVEDARAARRARPLRHHARPGVRPRAARCRRWPRASRAPPRRCSTADSSSYPEQLRARRPVMA